MTGTGKSKQRYVKPSRRHADIVLAVAVAFSMTAGATKFTIRHKQVQDLLDKRTKLELGSFGLLTGQATFTENSATIPIYLKNPKIAEGWIKLLQRKCNRWYFDDMVVNDRRPVIKKKELNRALGEHLKKLNLSHLDIEVAPNPIRQTQGEQVYPLKEVNQNGVVAETGELVIEMRKGWTKFVVNRMNPVSDQPLSRAFERIVAAEQRLVAARDEAAKGKKRRASKRQKIVPAEQVKREQEAPTYASVLAFPGQGTPLQPANAEERFDKLVSLFELPKVVMNFADASPTSDGGARIPFYAASAPHRQGWVELAPASGNGQEWLPREIAFEGKSPSLRLSSVNKAFHAYLESQSRGDDRLVLEGTPSWLAREQRIFEYQIYRGNIHGGKLVGKTTVAVTDDWKDLAVRALEIWDDGP